MHPFDPALLDALEELVNENWNRGVWRVVIGDTWPLRANQRGARWNPPGTEALYCALEESTAIAEVKSVVDRQPVPVTKPLIAYRLNVRLGKVIDLSSVRSFKGVGSLAAYMSEDIRLPQHLGGAVRWLGVAGLLVPSARVDSTNLVIFTQNLATTDEINIESPFWPPAAL